MSNKNKISRRGMLGRACGAAAAAIALPHTALFLPASAFGANDRIGVGVIGCGRRSAQHQNGRGGQGKPPASARVVAVADCHMKRAAQWAARYKALPFQDYRKLLDRKEVDVVMYATPEHWHYLPCIHACQAGKDIYGEQPLGHTLREGRVMVEAVRKYKRIFQTGEQQRSHPKTRKAVELIRNGRIGKVHTVIGYNYPSAFECDFPPQPIPEGLDWDRWCGPNEVVPYSMDLYVSRTPYGREEYLLEPAERYAVGPGWMSFRPYSGGELPNWGCHGLSMVQWALGTDHTGPVEIWVEPAEKLPTVVYENPESRDRGDAAVSKTILHYRYPNGVVLKLSGIDSRLGGGAILVGDKGRIMIYREGYECHPKGLDEDPLPANAERVYESDNHIENFFECVRSRNDPIMPVENGHRVASLCHLGNIARRLGRSLKWDPEKEIFPGDDEANQYLDCPKRKGYELPEKA